MKKIAFFCCLLIFSFVLGGCHKQCQSPCKLFIYGSFSRIYQINFNGCDSLETICGTFIGQPAKYKNKFGYILVDSIILGDKNFHLNKIYMSKAMKLNSEQAHHLTSILERLNSKEITDTVKGKLKDVWNICFFLKRQRFCLQTTGIKDSDIQMLVDTLKEYSPLFILEENDWWGMENELELIRMYDNRKKK